MPGKRTGKRRYMTPLTVTCSNPLIQELWQAAVAQGVSEEDLARLSGYGRSTLYYQRTRESHKLEIIQDLAAVLNLELKFVIKESK